MNAKFKKLNLIVQQSTSRQKVKNKRESIPEKLIIQSPLKFRNNIKLT